MPDIPFGLVCFLLIHFHNFFLFLLLFFGLFNFLCWSSQYLFCIIFFIVIANDASFRVNSPRQLPIPERVIAHTNFSLQAFCSCKKWQNLPRNINGSLTYTSIIPVNYEVHVLWTVHENVWCKFFLLFFAIKFRIFWWKARECSQWKSWEKLFSIISIRYKTKTMKGSAHRNYFIKFLFAKRWRMKKKIRDSFLCIYIEIPDEC